MEYEGIVPQLKREKKDVRIVRFQGLRAALDPVEGRSLF